MYGITGNRYAEVRFSTYLLWLANGVAVWNTPVLCVSISGEGPRRLGAILVHLVVFWIPHNALLGVTKSTGFAT